MARVAVLIDRSPACPEWKGAGAWALINALAESQHDIQIFTPLEPAEVERTHDRVGVARPAPSFAIRHLPAWARALVTYRPDVIHTFAPRASDSGRYQWPKLTCWPYLEGLGPLLPAARRVATLFDAGDLNSPATSWLRAHRHWTTFDRDLALTADFGGQLDLTSSRGLLPSAAPTETEFDDGEILVPAPIAEWRDRPSSLAALGAFLREDPSRRVRVVGGWGDLALNDRREMWAALADFTARVHLGRPLSLREFVRDAALARGLWPEPLRAGSWRARMSALVAGQDGEPGADVVNHLSRIYSAPGRW